MPLTLTVLFVALACYFLVAALSGWVVPGGGAPNIVTSAWHLLMSLVMVAMAWPAVTPPAIVTIVVFTAATLWFASRALFGAVRTDCDHGGGNSYHAAMMAAMALMAIVMAVWSTPTGWAGNAAESRAAITATAMPGMNMPGMNMPGAESAGAAVDVGAVATPAGATTFEALCLLVGTGFAVAALVLTVAAIRRRARRGWALAESGSAVAMAIGMSVAFFQLL